MSVLEGLKKIIPPSDLYHYTTQTGLSGILSDDMLWASKIHYLNDSTEFNLALCLAEEVLHKKLGADTLQKDKIKCLINNIKTIEKLNVCVASLSTRRDQLSQWRAYSGSTGGFAVWLNSESLKQQAEQQGFYLVKCIYSEEEQKTLIAALIDECLAEDFNVVPGYTDSSGRMFVALATGGDFAKKLAIIAPALKNISFEEESEWRLVSRTGINVQELSFRTGVSTLTPYYKFKLGEKSSYLKGITVGPTPNLELAANAAQMLLAKYNAGRYCTAYKTEIPFRNW